MKASEKRARSKPGKEQSPKLDETGKQTAKRKKHGWVLVVIIVVAVLAAAATAGYFGDELMSKLRETADNKRFSQYTAEFYDEITSDPTYHMSIAPTCFFTFYDANDEKNYLWFDEEYDLYTEDMKEDLSSGNDMFHYGFIADIRFPSSAAADRYPAAFIIEAPNGYSETLKFEKLENAKTGETSKKWNSGPNYFDHLYGYYQDIPSGVYTVRFFSNNRFVCKQTFRVYDGYKPNKDE